MAELRREVRKEGDPKRATVNQRFFKTGPGEYGEGDHFLGIAVPVLRRIANTFRKLGRRDLQKLLCSPFHEERLLALLILVLQYRNAEAREQRKIYAFYVRHLRCVNNWDLVDLSAGPIVGAQLTNRSKVPLYRWGRSNNLWERRVAILSTFHWIKQGEFEETLKIAKMLLRDKADLIHKAVGWMLREVGKRDLKSEERFLRKHYRSMPRTMLRYAIERFPETKRKAYLAGRIT